jgi:hypothetical protein
MEQSCWLSIAAGLLLVVVLAGCGASRSNEATAAPPAGSPAASGAPPTEVKSGTPQQSDFAGVWQGTTVAECGANSPLPSRCNALQNVTITLIEGPNSKLGGRYSCAYGNMDCYDANETGKVIDVSLNGARINIRVIMPDATSCIFTGMNVNQTINGGYTCYQGGSLLEEGAWRARRSY